MNEGTKGNTMLVTNTPNVPVHGTVWDCPHCGKEHITIGSPDRLTCSGCHKTLPYSEARSSRLERFWDECDEEAKQLSSQASGAEARGM